MKSVFLFCLTLAITIPEMFAQARQVAFRTLCLDFADDLQKLIIPGKDPKESLEVELDLNVSEVVEGTFLNDEAAFFTEKAGADGMPVRNLVAKTKLGKSARQLFVFVPTGQKGEGKQLYAVTSYDDDVKSFGMGFVRAINFAPVPVRFIISGQTTPAIPPTKYAQFPHSTKKNDFNMYPVVVEYLSGTGEWIKGKSVSWKATDRRREIVVTLVDGKYNKPLVRMYSDFPPWLEESESPDTAPEE